MALLPDTMFSNKSWVPSWEQSTYFYERGTPYYQVYVKIPPNLNRLSRHQHLHWVG